MANPEHVEILKQGVEAWNQWRKDNPDVKPDLSQLDFNTVFENSNVWGVWPAQRNSIFRDRDHTVVLNHINFRDIEARDCDFTGVDFARSDLRGAQMKRSKLSGANLHAVQIDDADLFNTDVADANFSRVRWTPSRRTRRSPRAGLDTMRGNPTLQRYWLDELHIDALRTSARGQPASWRAFFGSRGPLLRPWWIGFALLGAMLALVATTTYEPILEVRNAWPWVLTGGVIGAALGVFLPSHLGARTGFALWGLFDYGRSWSAVVSFAVLLISAFGAAYAFWLSPGDHVALGPGEPGADHWFYPWFVAAMGFATLGVADVAKPLTGLGQLMMIANVLAGFTTFGLLLSVLGNTFARRS